MLLRGCGKKSFPSLTGRSVALPRDPTLFVTSTLIGHPFKKEKSCLWTHFVRATLWIIWTERNRRIFQDKEHSLNQSFEAIVFLVISWCKCSPLFYHYSFATLASSWTAFLWPNSGSLPTFCILSHISFNQWNCFVSKIKLLGDVWFMILIKSKFSFKIWAYVVCVCIV